MCGIWDCVFSGVFGIWNGGLPDVFGNWNGVLGIYFTQDFVWVEGEATNLKERCQRGDEEV